MTFSQKRELNRVVSEIIASFHKDTELVFSCLHIDDVMRHMKDEAISENKRTRGLQFTIGIFYCKASQYSLARYWLAKAAMQGHKQASKLLKYFGVTKNPPTPPPVPDQTEKERTYIVKDLSEKRPPVTVTASSFEEAIRLGLRRHFVKVGQELMAHEENGVITKKFYSTYNKLGTGPDYSVIIQ